MPKVAIIGTRGYPSYYGGFETAVRHLAPYLADRGWEVVVYGRPGKTAENEVHGDTRVRTVQTRGLETKSLSTLSYGLTATAHAAFKEKPDVALVMNVANGFFLPFLKFKKIPSLVNVDGIEWDRAKWGRVAKKLFRSGASFTARFADRLVYDAHAIADRWQRDFKRSGVFIPYGGTDPGDLAPVEGFKAGAYALIVARFVPENTVPEFLAAARKIAVSHPVVIVGSSGYGGTLDHEAQKLSDEYGNVHWLGHVSDDHLLFSLLKYSGAYFHGHSVGGTNPALVQAIACGAPVVARDTVYNREVLSDQGTFVNPDPDEIAGAILAMLNSPADQERSRKNSLERSKTEYTWQKVCSAYECELRRLAGENTL